MTFEEKRDSLEVDISIEYLALRDAYNGASYKARH